MSSKRILNPELEYIRQKVEEEEKPLDLGRTVSELIEKTSRVHAGFLFNTKYGKNVLHEMCLRLSATKTSNLYAGWEELGIYLGIDPLKIQCIRNQFKESDPSQLMLKVYVQQEDATLDRIISSLNEIKRNDIIVQTKDLILNLANEVYQSNQVEDDSGYCSLSESGSIADREEILRPGLLPQVELIFQDLSPTQLTTVCTAPPCSPLYENESYLESSSEENRRITTSQQQNKHEYSCTVMLTFAKDGFPTAVDVARKFREKHDNHLPIGVVILNEHADLVNYYPGEFIHSCFAQVDYVLPIITKDYLSIITSNSMPTDNTISCIDQNYVKLIYKEMETDYLRRGCINKKVRCVIPDDFVRTAQKHTKMAEPLFQAWVRSSEIQELKQRILNVTF